MPTSTRTLRWILAMSAVVLIVVVLGFVSYAQLRARRMLFALPGRLGIDVKQETNGFTYSQSVRGQTVFTVHAAKEIQRKDGKIALHDVGIVLYGRDAGRADKIHGNEFEYDQVQGVLRAVGDVYLDLSAPAANPQADKDSRMIHVKTNGLMFQQKERLASTEGAIEFIAGGYTGQAVGALYDSASGVVTLRSAVRVSGLRQERPVTLTAAHAELDRAGNVVRLTSAKYVSPTSHGVQTMEAESTLVYLTRDGSPQNVKAEGAVTLREDTHATVTAGRIDLELGQSGQPHTAFLAGGVRFVSEDGTAGQRRGQAGEARILFDEAGTPVHAAMRREVTLEEKAGANERTLHTANLDLTLGGGGKQRVVLQDAKAFGGALGLPGALIQMTTMSIVGGGREVTAVQANTLNAHFGTASRLAMIDGNGATSVVRTVLNARNGVTSREASSGDVLRMDFSSDGKRPAELTSALQRGNVSLVRTGGSGTIARKPGESNQVPAMAGLEHARGQELSYDARLDRMTISGEVEASDAESALFADRVVVDRSSGDATATGSVKVSYQQPGVAGEPVHIAAARAVSRRASGISEFYADGAAKVRLWQGGSQVEAPVIELDQAKRQIVAKGTAAEATDAVKTVLAGSLAAAGTSPSRSPGTGLVHVASETMTYNDVSRQVEFKGHVRVNDSAGILRATEATIFLAPRKVASAKQAVGSLGGQVDRIVARGAIEIQQPGRLASGDKLTYAAADHTYRLTGTKDAPPKLMDEVRGLITGASLQFRSGDDSVVVTGGDEQNGTGRVRSEGRLKQRD